ncbi:MAG: DUF2442 domain-containing protein [Bdellovibrionota bacterium]
MSSSRLGGATSRSEVTNIGIHGFWFLDEGREYFVPFKEYPEFRKATIGQIHIMRKIGPGQFHWPDLDIDIEIVALESPEQFLLKFKRIAKRPRARAARGR